MTTVRNHLLESYRNITGYELPLKLEAVALPAQTILFGPESRPRYVHFLTSGLATVVSMMGSGEGMGISMTGNSSIPENAYLLGAQIAPKRCTMQIAGTALRARMSAVEEAFAGDTVLRQLVLQGLQSEIFVMAHLAACNGLHPAEGRLARWLLMMQDYAGSRDLVLTQEYLSQMLGIRRTTVNILVVQMQKSGLIGHSRGRISIRNREGLKNAACECYPVMHAFMADLYGPCRFLPQYKIAS